MRTPAGLARRDLRAVHHVVCSGGQGCALAAADCGCPMQDPVRVPQVLHAAEGEHEPWAMRRTVTPNTAEPQGVTMLWQGCGAGTVVRSTTAPDGERLCEVRPDDG